VPSDRPNGPQRPRRPAERPRAAPRPWRRLALALAVVAAVVILVWSAGEHGEPGPARAVAQAQAPRGPQFFGQVKVDDIITKLLDQVKTSRAVVLEFMEEFAEAAAEMSELTK